MKEHQNIAVMKILNLLILSKTNPTWICLCTQETDFGVLAVVYQFSTIIRYVFCGDSQQRSKLTRF